jgi:hypothetical protein
VQSASVVVRLQLRIVSAVRSFARNVKSESLSMSTLRDSMLRAQLSKPLRPSQPEKQVFGTSPTRMPGSADGRLRDIAGIEARFSALDRKLDTLIHMLSEPDEARGQIHHVLVTDVRRVVAKHFGITEQDLDRQGRSSRIVHIRQIAFYLCRRHTARSFADIGRLFGDRHHSTVLHGVRRIAVRRKTDAVLDRDLSELETDLGNVLARRQ